MHVSQQLQWNGELHPASQCTSESKTKSKHQTQKIHHRTWDCDSFTFNDKWDLNSVLFSLRHYNIWKVQRVFKNGNLNLKQDYGVHDVHDVHEAYDSLLTCHSTEKSKPNVKGLRFCICKLHMQVNRQMRLEAISSKGMYYESVSSLKELCGTSLLCWSFILADSFLH